MIITRTPLRISFVGGGSDQPAFYADEPGMVISATLDKYIYLTVNRKYDGTVRVSYSKTENVERSHEVEHSLVRACLQLANVRSGIEITSIADLPAGTGLGSSSAFTVGLLHALFAYQGEYHADDNLADSACHVEIGLCHSPIGKQDQYAAAYGGLRSYTFHADHVDTELVALPADALRHFERNLLLLDTGIRRDANVILGGQQADLRDSRKRANVRSMVNLAHAFRDYLAIGAFDQCGEVLDTAWALKRHMAGVSNDQIDQWYALAKKAGALGGKVCGAGGGGMLLFYAPQSTHADIGRATGLRRIPIRLTHHGSQVIYAD